MEGYLILYDAGILGLLLQQLYNTVDTIIVGNFAGESQLAEDFWKMYVERGECEMMH